MGAPDGLGWMPEAQPVGSALSLSHNMGATATADMDALPSPTSFEQMDGNSSNNGQHFAAELAYGFPVYNNQLILTPTLAFALSTTTSNYSLLWSLAPYAEQNQAHP